MRVNFTKLYQSMYVDTLMVISMFIIQLAHGLKIVASIA